MPDVSEWILVSTLTLWHDVVSSWALQKRQGGAKSTSPRCRTKFAAGWHPCHPRRSEGLIQIQVQLVTTQRLLLSPPPLLVEHAAHRVPQLLPSPRPILPLRLTHTPSPPHARYQCHLCLQGPSPAISGPGSPPPPLGSWPSRILPAQTAGCTAQRETTIPPAARATLLRARVLFQAPEAVYQVALSLVRPR